MLYRPLRQPGNVCICACINQLFPQPWFSAAHQPPKDAYITCAWMKSCGPLFTVCCSYAHFTTLHTHIQDGLFPVGPCLALGHSLMTRCDGCADTVKKPKLDSHRQRCHAPFTCLGRSLIYWPSTPMSSGRRHGSRRQEETGLIHRLLDDFQ
jgi:hypothetical protein